MLQFYLLIIRIILHLCHLGTFIYIIPTYMKNYQCIYCHDNCSRHQCFNLTFGISSSCTTKICTICIIFIFRTRSKGTIDTPSEKGQKSTLTHADNKQNPHKIKCAQPKKGKSNALKSKRKTKSK